MTVADRIIERRKELGLTQEDLAKKLGLSGRSSISKIEKAGDDITLKNIKKIAPSLECSVPYLMGYETKINIELEKKLSEDTTIPTSSDPMHEALDSYIQRFSAHQKKLLESYIKLLAQED